MRSAIFLFIVGIFLFLNCFPTYAQQDIQWEKSISQVRILVEKNPELLNFEDKDGWTPLLKAVDMNDMELVEYLVGKGADVNVKYRQGLTSLDLASGKGNEKVVKLLISKGAKINGERISPLDGAVSNGHVGVTEILIANGADVNRFDAIGQTPLGTTISGFTPWDKKFEMLDLLVKSGAKINLKDAHENTPLYYAVETGDEKLVEVLLSYGANIHTSCAADDTPLTLAVKLGRYDIAKKMMKRDWTVKGFVLVVLIAFLSIYAYVWWKKRRQGSKGS